MSGDAAINNIKGLITREREREKHTQRHRRGDIERGDRDREISQVRTVL